MLVDDQFTVAFVGTIRPFGLLPIVLNVKSPSSGLKVLNPTLRIREPLAFEGRIDSEINMDLVRPLSPEIVTAQPLSFLVGVERALSSFSIR